MGPDVMIEPTYLYLALVFIKAFAALWATAIVAVAAFGVTWASVQITKTFLKGHFRK